MRIVFHLRLFAALVPVALAHAQDAPLSVSGKWNFTLQETFSPLILPSGAFNAGLSQAAKTDPQYGQGMGALAQRFGASIANNVSENLFGDFLLASALHEDPRYFRKGPGHRVWYRAAYAISRAVVTRKDSGSDTFNWSNVGGNALSAGLSNAYYPPASRTLSATALNFGTTLAGTGFVHLLPEFWPDVRAWFKKHHSGAQDGSPQQATSASH